MIGLLVELVIKLVFALVWIAMQVGFLVGTLLGRLLIVVPPLLAKGFIFLIRSVGRLFRSMATKSYGRRQSALDDPWLQEARFISMRRDDRRTEGADRVKSRRPPRSYW
jgi:hypothetical protein